MEKLKAEDMQQIIWYCKKCGHFDVIMEFKEFIKQDNAGNVISRDTRPVSVFNKIEYQKLPSFLDSRKEKIYGNQKVAKQLFEQAQEKDWSLV